MYFFLFAYIVGALGVSFVAWSYIYRNTTVVKLAQAGHTAVFCLGGIYIYVYIYSYISMYT
jgi:hypothetical protein